MPLKAKYVHTNIVARDWKKLSRFYEQVLGCIPVLPERHLSGEWLEKGTAVPNARIDGIHLRLPGYGEKGPTLEIFQYNPILHSQVTAANQAGFGHIAFSVEDVVTAQKATIRAGGRTVGEVVSLEVPGAGCVTFVYVTDPEGNIIELQQWQ